MKEQPKEIMTNENLKEIFNIDAEIVEEPINKNQFV